MGRTKAGAGRGLSIWGGAGAVLLLLATGGGQARAELAARAKH